MEEQQAPKHESVVVVEPTPSPSQSDCSDDHQDFVEKQVRLNKMKYQAKNTQKAKIDSEASNPFTNSFDRAK